MQKRELITASEFNWPPEYVLKYHRRAKSIKLRIGRSAQLEITVPARFNSRELLPILERHKLWILDQLAQLAVKQASPLPTELHLLAIAETWRIHYLQTNADSLKLTSRPMRELVLMGNTQDKALCRSKMVAWLKKYALSYLTQELSDLSEQCRLYYTGINIRDQKTIWGSCTAGRSISLNYKLLFLPAKLMRYVLIHELCHTKYLNHSPSFWTLVQQYDPNWREHRAALRQADQYVPAVFGR